MSGKRGDAVARPLRKSEYELVFISREAGKRWSDCLAVARNAMVDAWERLTTEPTSFSDRQYQLQADYAQGTYGGKTFDRWQYKITNGGRIWYFVDSYSHKYAGRVLVERVTAKHPKETD